MVVIFSNACRLFLAAAAFVVVAESALSQVPAALQSRSSSSVVLAADAASFYQMKLPLRPR